MDRDRIETQTVAAVLVCIGLVATVAIVVWASVHSFITQEWPTWTW